MQLIVCETTGDWAAWLKRELSGEATIVEIRRLDEIWGRLAPHTPAVVAIDLQNFPVADCLVAFLKIDREYPVVVTVALAHRRLCPLEPAIKEAGAAWFLESPRRLCELVSLVRHLAAKNPAPPVGDADCGSIEDRVFASLPWRG